MNDLSVARFVEYRERLIDHYNYGMKDTRLKCPHYTTVKTEYYADLDEDTELYCVFGSDTGDHAFASFADMEDAKEWAKKMNAERVGQ